MLLKLYRLKQEAFLQAIATKNETDYRFARRRYQDIAALYYRVESGLPVGMGK